MQSLVIPSSHRHPEACIKFQTMGVPNHNATQSRCWVLDDFMVTRRSQKTSLAEDFDPLDATNWLVLGGGQVQVGCRANIVGNYQTNKQCKRP